MARDDEEWQPVVAGAGAMRGNVGEAFLEDAPLLRLLSASARAVRAAGGRTESPPGSPAHGASAASAAPSAALQK